MSALPQRAENKLHVSLMENYPGTLEALGEPIRQVGGLASAAMWWGVAFVGAGLIDDPGVCAQGWGQATTVQPHLLIPQGHFIVWEGAPGARMPWKGHNRHVFLFRNHLVICKPRRDSRTDTFSYVFRNMMKVCGARGWGCHAGQWRFPCSWAPGWPLEQNLPLFWGDLGMALLDPVCLGMLSSVLPLMLHPSTVKQHRLERPGGRRRPCLRGVA